MKQRPRLLAGENLPPEPRQARSRERRERLKRAALAVFAAKGYQSASIEEIAARAKLPVGSFYQHFRSKRQLLLALMDELLEMLSKLDFRLQSGTDIREGLRGVLGRAFARDLEYLGAYRAWQEAVLGDSDLARKQRHIQAWTADRAETVFHALQQLPGARPGVDVAGLARAMDTFFWSLLAQALKLRKPELERWIDAATHLIFHALFRD